MSDVGWRKWLASHSWPPKKATWLKGQEMRSFELAYIKYRKGHSRGAKGEVFSVSEKTQPAADSSVIRCTSIFQEFDEDPQTIKWTRKLEEYRRAYRQFRTGKSRGASGELSRIGEQLSPEQLTLLPVAALARCLADQARYRQVPEPRFHSHIGAGKLGLGLVVPAMVASAVPFAILQRPSECWRCLMDSGLKEVQLQINDQSICRLAVIRNASDLEAIGLLVEGKIALRNNSGNADVHRLLVFDQSLHRLLIQASDSLSCSLGPGVKELVGVLTDALKPNSGIDRPVLYACENDQKAIDSIRLSLDASCYVKECMVDRICAQRVIHPDNIEVVAEPYRGDIVVSARYPSAIPPGFGGSNVLKPITEGAYAYLYQRKFLLVNGTHTTLAFMTLRRAETTDTPGDHELLAPHDFSDEEQAEHRAWLVARCLVLLHSHELTVMKLAQGVSSDDVLVEDLWRFAEQTLKRFATVKDTTGRVLGGGMANRYETRLKEVLMTLETFHSSVPLGQKMLAQANFASMRDLKATLKKLVDDAGNIVDGYTNN